MAKVLMVGNITYSDAFRKLVADGGSITRLHWRSAEYKNHDVHAGARQHIVAITARDLELPDGTRLGSSRDGWFVHAVVQVVMYDGFAVTEDWQPSQPDLLAQDWEWYPPRRGT